MAPRKRRASIEDDPEVEEENRAQTRAQKRAREEEEAQRLIAAGTGEYRAGQTEFNCSPLIQVADWRRRRSRRPVSSHVSLHLCHY